MAHDLTLLLLSVIDLSGYGHAVSDHKGSQN
jgi:hypothetical protein